MLVTLHRRFDIAAPGLHRRARATRGSFAGSNSLQPRSGYGSAASPLRGSFSRWLRDSLARSQRSFASPSLQDGAGGDALTYPERMAALGRVVASTRGVLAAQAHAAAHKAARSHTP